MSKKNKATLTTQSCHWFITIRKNIDLPIRDIKAWVEQYTQGEMYGFIEHKGDISPLTGEIEGTHYHIVMNTCGRKQKLGLLNSLVKTFELDNAFGIECDTYDTFEGCLQYLTHQNTPEKTQHKREEIITNIDSDTFNAILDTPLANTLTIDMLLTHIKMSENPVQLAQKLGLGTFDHYLKTIRVLWKIVKRCDINDY